MDEVATRLRDARAQRGLTLDEVANATRIPRATLANLEAGRYELLPAAVFVRGFIRSYARVVGIDPNPIVRAYESRGQATGPSHVASASRPLSPAALRVGEVGRRLGYGPRDEVFVDPSPAEADTGGGPRLDTERKLVPLQPVSMRREGGLRGGFMLIAVAAAGLLVAAWILVGQKKPTRDDSARGPAVPVIHDRIDGMPAFDGPGPRVEVPELRPAPNPGERGFFDGAAPPAEQPAGGDEAPRTPGRELRANVRGSTTVNPR